MANLPLITVTIVPTQVAQLVVPGGDHGSWALAHRVTARVLEMFEVAGPHQVRSLTRPYIERGRQDTCVVVRIAAKDSDGAKLGAELLAEAAVLEARDGFGFATHRIERK